MDEFDNKILNLALEYITEYHDMDDDDRVIEILEAFDAGARCLKEEWEKKIREARVGESG